MRILVLNDKSSTDMLESVISLACNKDTEVNFLSARVSILKEMKKSTYDYLIMDSINASNVNGLREDFPDVKFICWQSTPYKDPYIPMSDPVIPKAKFDYFPSCRNDLYKIISP